MKKLKTIVSLCSRVVLWDSFEMITNRAAGGEEIRMGWGHFESKLLLNLVAM
jgi:hypothetical protein